MRIACLIDSLNSGGAQRQMTWLCRALVEAHYDVQLFTYHDFEHYKPDVQALGIEPVNVSANSKAGRFWAVRKAIRASQPDLIISFLDTPNLLGIVAALPPSPIPIIVSERNHNVHGLSRAVRMRCNTFRFATRVVTNSFAQHDFVHRHFPFLRNKLSTIWNCVDLDRFCPSPEPEHNGTRLLVAASICERKNADGLIRAVNIARSRGSEISVQWFGNNFYRDGQPTADSAYFHECQSLIEELDLQSHFHFREPVGNIESQFAEHDACCLPSFQEGCPNVICESLASGVSVLASNHGDLKKLVSPERGLLFDPADAQDIADKIMQFAAFDCDSRAQMRIANRAYAERELSPERFAKQYCELVQEVVES